MQKSPNIDICNEIQSGTRWDEVKEVVALKVDGLRDADENSV